MDYLDDSLGSSNREDYNKQIEDFENFWRKEAKDIRKMELTEAEAHKIRSRYETNEARLKMDMPFTMWLMKQSTYDQRLEIVRSQLFNSVAMAESKFKGEHMNLLERLIDTIGKSMGAILSRK